MKTTIELPDQLFREAKATAARRGKPLKDLFREALERELDRQPSGKQWPVPPPDVPIAELRQIDKFIEEAFERIDAEN